MKTITMKQLRQKFGPVRKGLDRGEEYLLMYRSKPLAVIRPYSAETDRQHLPGSKNNEETAKKAPSLPQAQTVKVKPANKPLEKLGMKKAFI